MGKRCYAGILNLVNNSVTILKINTYSQIYIFILLLRWISLCMKSSKWRRLWNTYYQRSWQIYRWMTGRILKIVIKQYLTDIEYAQKTFTYSFFFLFKNNLSLRFYWPSIFRESIEIYLRREKIFNDSVFLELSKCEERCYADLKEVSLLKDGMKYLSLTISKNWKFYVYDKQKTKTRLKADIKYIS